MGITAHKAIDPVVFSLTTGYRWNHSRRDGPIDYKPGNLLFVTPSIGFAANDRVTLTGGVQWGYRQPDQLAVHAQDIRRTSTDLVLGVGYGVAKGNIVPMTLKTLVN